jgi:nitrogen fixation/metabolism regulation signal transduction histidine kinase
VNDVRTLRSRLVAAFLLSTLLPLAATVWITTTLLDRSLGYATTSDLDRLAQTLESTVRLLYQRERDALRHDAVAGTLAGTQFEAADRASWPEPVRVFWESGEAERFGLSGAGGEQMEYLQRSPGGVTRYMRDLRGIRMADLSAQLREARDMVAALDRRDLRRGFTLTLLILLAVAWLISLVPLVLIARRITGPIQQLTAGLTTFADEDRSPRLQPAGHDEVGRAIDAFNRMADQIRESRTRLVHLTQMASWQSLARKTAHELKNSLTPIRLTVEEMLARQPASVDRTFMESAVQIVVSEIDTLERRVRSFSEFAAEPGVRLEPIDVNALVSERVALLAPAYPGTDCRIELDPGRPKAHGDADLLKGVLTNLLQNAAEAAGTRGRVVARTVLEESRAVVEVLDSGPGLGAEAAASLFEPTISFKRNGMGLGLSIAKRNAILCGGDIAVGTGELGGASFRLTLPLTS